MERILVFLFLGLTYSISAQIDKNALDKFIENHTDEQNNFKEKIFLHTNKSHYYAGEKVWFKSYVVNDINNIPSYRTTNLYINLYNKEFHLVDSKLFFVENGTSYGEIRIPENSESGHYYLETTTNSLKNFDRDSEHFTRIEVTNLMAPSSSEQHQKEATSNSLELELYPESNVFLESSENTLGIKANKDGKPIAVKGVIIDNNQREISPFYTNKYGIGKCKFAVLPGETYKAVLNDDGNDLTYTIPTSVSTGVIIHLRPKKKDSQGVEFLLKTNRTTTTAIKWKQYYFVLHRGSAISYVVPLKFSEQYDQYSVPVETANLFEGVNEATLFNNQNIPLSHRYFYYKNPANTINLSASLKSSSKDSVLLQVQAKNHLLRNVNTALSISVLPDKTLNYTDSKNINSSFLVNPYLKENLPNLTKYFKENAAEAYLNLAMLTLSKKDLNKSFNKNNDQKKYTNETGLSIRGTVNFKNPRNESYRVLLTSKENNIMYIKELTKDRSFAFDSLYLKYPSKYELSLLDIKGKPVKAGFYVKKKLSKYEPDSVLTNTVFLDRIRMGEEKYKLEELVENQPKNESKVRELDEVIVTADRNTFNYDELLPTGLVIAESFTKSYKIKDGTQDDNSTLLNLLDNMPGVMTGYSSFATTGSTKISTTRGPKSITGNNYTMLIEIDGVLISDNSILEEIKARDVIEVKVNSMGAGYGVRGGNGVILVKTRNTADYNIKKSTHSVYHRSATSIAFASPSSYENFPLNFVNNDSEQYFSTIGWFPAPQYNALKAYEIKIPKTSSKTVKLIINGIDKKGGVFFEKLRIDVPLKQVR